MRRPVAWLAALLVANTALAAEEDKDLDLIPQAVQQSTPTPASSSIGTGAQRNYIENAFSFTPLRNSLAVPFPPPTPASWQDRLFLDSRDEWRLGDSVTLNYSGRLNLRAGNDVVFPSRENVRNDLRELFVSWHPAEGTWIDLGRINLKSGVAIGYNPTDFFRTRAVVEPLTADPSVLREDRLGTLMLMGQQVWTGGSLTVAIAPKLTQPTAIYNSINLPSFDPVLDRTNAQDRLLIKGSLNLSEKFTLEPLLYHAGNRTQFGANLTAGLGQQSVGYIEWAGGTRPNLIADALNYGRTTGSLPAGALHILPNDPNSFFANDLSAGFSYTPPETKVTFNAEYHFHQAGFSARDWHNWFGAAATRGGILGVDSTLWYIRSYAQDQQEPVARHGAFLRADWVDAFVTSLEITALANIDLQDGSGLVQATADYYISRAWTVGGLVSFTFGGRQSDFGSLPQQGAILLRLVRYL